VQPRERKGSLFFTELRAGLACFFAMAYIIAVNASIVSDSGGTCVCNSTADDPICVKNQDYALCVAEIKRDMVTATAAIASLTTFCMGLFANLPIGVAPGELVLRVQRQRYMKKADDSLLIQAWASTLTSPIQSLAFTGLEASHIRLQ
jgi:hypothetical protein